MEKGFETLGIKYMFKPIEMAVPENQEFFRVIDMLKHANGLWQFIKEFKQFLS